MINKFYKINLYKSIGTKNHTHNIYIYTCDLRQTNLKCTKL